MKNAIILQGWYLKPDCCWYPWLKMELEKRGYKVFIPELPTMYTDLPDLQKQLNYIEKNIDLNKNTLVIGHSLGAVLGLRLAEKFQYKKLFMVAGWDFDDLTEEHKLYWKNKIDHKRIVENVENIYCITSDNDPYTTAFTAEQMSKRLRGKYVLVKGKCHFDR